MVKRHEEENFVTMLIMYNRPRRDPVQMKSRLFLFVTAHSCCVLNNYSIFFSTMSSINIFFF